MKKGIKDIDIEAAGMGLYTPEVVRDMIQASVEHENRENPQAHLQIIEMDKLAKYLESTQEEGRQQLIIYKGNHYMAADILVKNGVKSCILLDAANDPRYLAAETCFNAAGYKTYTACGFSFSPDKNLQADVYSCSLFALDHCAQFAKTPDTIHSQVEARSDEINSFYWDVMSPNFLWNMQSTVTKNQYTERYPAEAAMPTPNQISFNAYTDLGLVTDSSGKQRNNSINAHVFETVETIYVTQQREQALAKMDSKIEEVMGQKKPDTQQIETLHTIRVQLAQSSDLSQFEDLAQRFDAAANPTKTSMLRSALNFMRGTSSEQKEANNSSRSGRTPGKF